MAIIPLDFQVGNVVAIHQDGPQWSSPPGIHAFENRLLQKWWFFMSKIGL